ncbi:sigma-70 family RNA polymerase sigma factor [Candidatus Woesearchaeota archaeon]|nr:sigma-70 family RNA polymerase sigma factor [Candidatus Woesearchaeota archaeon]
MSGYTAVSGPHTCRDSVSSVDLDGDLYSEGGIKKQLKRFHLPFSVVIYEMRRLDEYGVSTSYKYIQKVYLGYLLEARRYGWANVKRKAMVSVRENWSEECFKKEIDDYIESVQKNGGKFKVNQLKKDRPYMAKLMRKYLYRPYDFEELRRKNISRWDREIILYELKRLKDSDVHITQYYLKTIFPTFADVFNPKRGYFKGFREAKAEIEHRENLELRIKAQEILAKEKISAKDIIYVMSPEFEKEDFFPLQIRKKRTYQKISDERGPIEVFIKNGGVSEIPSRDEMKCLFEEYNWCNYQIERIQKKSEKLRLKEIDIALLEEFVRRRKESLEELIFANKKLVATLAKKYGNIIGLDMDDLLDEGVCGLLKAITKFNYNKGYTFGTYGGTSIKREITRAIAEQSRTIRLPEWLVDDMYKVQKQIAIFTGKYGREPENEELSELTRMKPEKVVHIRGFIENPQRVFSINNLRGDGKTEFGEFIDSTEVVWPDKEFMSHELTLETKELLEHLNERERDVLIQLFDYHRTQEEIGKIYGVTKERINQMKAEALAKLKKIIEEDQ